MKEFAFLDDMDVISPLDRVDRMLGFVDLRRGLDDGTDDTLLQ